MSETTTRTDQLLDLLARWQAFSELQQRAFAFLAAEAVATGAEFESSTDGATQVLTRMGDGTNAVDPAEVQAETWAVVHRLQAADRSRQGLEQVASVLETLRRQHAELAQANTRLAELPHPEAERWIAELSAGVTLAEWRRRLVEALHGRDPGPREATEEDEELF